MKMKVAAIALVASAALAGVAQAQCRVNVAVQNAESGRIEIMNGRADDTSVRTNPGTWRDLRRGGWFDDRPVVRLRAGRTVSDVFSAAFNCNAQRRYRVEYRCANGSGASRVVYFPGPTSFTTRQDVTVRLSGLGC